MNTVPRGMGGMKAGVLPEDLDLDNVLDNYLVQLQTDMTSNGPGPGQMPHMAGHMGMGPQNPGILGLGGLHGNMPAAMMQQGSFLGMPGPGNFQNSMNMHQALAGRMGPAGMGPQAVSPPGGMASMLNSSIPTNTRTRRVTDSRATRSKPDSNGGDSDAQSSDGSASSGEQKSRKKREVSHDDDLSVAEKRHLALQEKNRRAQRRFRERQKVRSPCHFSYCCDAGRTHSTMLLQMMAKWVVCTSWQQAW